MSQAKNNISKIERDVFFTSQILSIKEKCMQKAPLSYISCFCNFYSCLLVFPYKMMWCQSSANFILVSSKPRKIICSFTHTLALVASTPYLVGFFHHLNQGWKKPSSVLSGATNITCFTIAIDLVHLMWKKREKILDAANWHINMQISHTIPFYKIIILCVFPITHLMLDNPLAGTLNELLGTPSQNGYSFNMSFLTSENNVFGSYYSLVYVCMLYGHLYYMASTGFILALTLSMRESLVQLMKTKTKSIATADVALYQGINMDANIRNLLNDINKIMSNKVLLEYLMMLSFYAKVWEFFDWNYTGSDFHRLHVFSYLLFSGAFWICACEVHCLARNYVKDWAHWYRSTFLLVSPESLKQYPMSLIAVQTEADINPACVSCRAFNVTYGFLGSMFCLIITYSTIVYQMKSDKIET